MTRTACNVIVNITKLCLAYRSIKVLKRDGSKKADGPHDDDYYDDDDDGGDKHNRTLGKNEDDNENVGGRDDSEINDADLEILQLWSLVAFLAIYDKSGIDYFLSFLPLYYYFKMILVIVTVIPSTKFPNFWCEVMLIPMMQKCHELLVEVNWRDVLQRESILLPFRILDVTIMPGLLCDDTLVDSVKRKRMKQLEDANHGKYILFNWVNESGEAATAATAATATTAATAATLEESPKKTDHVENIDEFEDENEYDNRKDDNTLSSILPHDGTLDMIDEDQLVEITDLNDSPSISTPSSPTSSKKTSLKYTSITNPVARSRVAASSLHLRKFSRDHKPSSTLIRESTKNHSKHHRNQRNTPKTRNAQTAELGRTKNTVPPMSAFQQTKFSQRNDDDVDDDGSSSIQDSQENITTNDNNNSINTFNSVMDEMEEEEDKFNELLSSSKSSNKNKNNENQNHHRRKKDSLNQRLRNFITGDTNIRIRDYLFDVELPSVPSRDSNLSFSKTFESEKIYDNEDEDTISDDDYSDDYGDDHDGLKEGKDGGMSSGRRRLNKSQDISSLPYGNRNRTSSKGEKKSDMSNSVAESNDSVRRSQRLRNKRGK